MGSWNTKHGIGSDSWADEMGRTMQALSNNKIEDHEITMAEFADLVEFSSCGHLQVTFRDDSDIDRPLSKLHDKEVETRPNAGQSHGVAKTDS